MLSITLGLVLLLGLSYAWFTLTLNGTKQNVVKVGKLSLALTEGNAITINNMVPTYTDVALSETPYTFTVTNDGTVDANYQIYLDNVGTITNLTRFNYALKKDGKMLHMNSLNRLTDSKLFSGTIRPGESSEFELYIWLDANTTTDFGDKTYESRIRIESVQQKEQKLSTLVMHACDGQTNCTRTRGDTTYFQQYYYDLSTKYIWYSGKMWIATSYDNEGNVKAITNTELAYMPWGSTLDYKGSYVETWINEKFVPGLNNYQKFLVTDYPWNYSDEIEGSGYSDSWTIGTDKIVKGPVGLLNKDDLYYASDQDGNLNGGDVILGRIGSYYYMATTLVSGKKLVGGTGYVNSGSGYTLNSSSFAGVAPSVVFKKDVTVISGSGTLEDPYRLKGDESGSTGDLLNTRNSGEYVAFGENLNSSYRISEIEDGKVKLIATRALGKYYIQDDKEYWTFLDSWITAYDETSGAYIYQYPYKKGSGSYLQYDGNSTNYPLAYFLNHDFLNPSNGYLSLVDKNMILTNQSFYTGTVTGSSSYKSAKDTSKKVTTTVGLPMIGDPFSAISKEDWIGPKILQQTGNLTVFMTNNGTTVYYQEPNQFITTYDEEIGDSFRPSLYLKSTVKIKSGSGTKMDPYILQS